MHSSRMPSSPSTHVSDYLIIFGRIGTISLVCIFFTRGTGRDDLSGLYLFSDRFKREKLFSLRKRIKKD